MAGKYLQSLKVPVNRIVWSTKNRAVETGRIISKYFDGEQIVRQFIRSFNWVWINPMREFLLGEIRYLFGTKFIDRVQGYNKIVINSTVVENTNGVRSMKCEV